MAEGSQSFSSMAGAKPTVAAPEVGIGMLGYAFMGKAHSNAFKKLPYMMYPPVAIPKLIAVCGRDAKAAAAAAERFGYEGFYTDWRKMLEDKRIQVFDNGGPNDTHADPCIEAAKAGKNVFCEKPLARTAAEAKTMWDAAVKAGVKHQAAFNYRFVPAIRQAFELIRGGKLGKLYHFRAFYLQEWIMAHYNTPMIWRTDKKRAGSGALGDLGSHILDLARFLMGEVKSVSAMTKTFISNWWPHGHIIGWEHSFVHQFHHFLDCIVNKKEVAPYAATFEDGYRNAVICDAILESAAGRRQIDVVF
jgi:predicted dehydrogenase